MSRRAALACLTATVTLGVCAPAGASYGTGSYGTGLAKKAQGFKYDRALVKPR